MIGSTGTSLKRRRRISRAPARRGDHGDVGPRRATRGPCPIATPGRHLRVGGQDLRHGHQLLGLRRVGVHGPVPHAPRRSHPARASRRCSTTRTAPSPRMTASRRSSAAVGRSLRTRWFEAADRNVLPLARWAAKRQHRAARTGPAPPRGGLISDGWTYGQLGLEGLVAERLESIYRPGERSRNWVKAKCPDWRVNHAPAPAERWSQDHLDVAQSGCSGAQSRPTTGTQGHCRAHGTGMDGRRGSQRLEVSGDRGQRVVRLLIDAPCGSVARVASRLHHRDAHSRVAKPVIWPAGMGPPGVSPGQLVRRSGRCLPQAMAPVVWGLLVVTPPRRRGCAVQRFEQQE
jgi:hypothetical protein